MTKQARASLFASEVLDFHPITVLDDLGDPPAVTMPMIALVAEDADGA